MRQQIPALPYQPGGDGTTLSLQRESTEARTARNDRRCPVPSGS
jgi:hypothetical protein